MSRKPVVLMILDGWGLNDNVTQKNAIRDVNPKVFNGLMKEYPSSRLKASGEAVGLPEGQMGNSEVGHLNIGAGRVVYQPLVKISKDIRDGDFFEIETLKDAYSSVKENSKALHLGGLLSDGGVHSHINHLVGLLKMAKKYELEKVYVHAFLDGRDTPPKSAIGYIKKLEEAMAEIGVGEIATVSGRYYSMDRDTNWERTKLAYDVIAKGEGVKTESAAAAVEAAYAKGDTDEFVLPTIIVEGVKLSEGDSFINFNFRPDRARQITRAINDKEFSGFEREYIGVKFLCMRQYDSTIEAPIVYVDEELVNTFGEVVSKAGLKQLRTAETEKYAHVTFFFNGGKEAQYEGEDRKLVASPKVATYDLKPEMSAYEVTDGLLEALEDELYDVVIVNLANPDMVGHTGVYEAAKKAVEVVDECLGKVADKIIAKDGVLLVTADHGNVDLMEDPITKVPFTAHTTNDVPLLFVSNKYKNCKIKDGKLADLAPTMLDILNIEKPAEMTGESLLIK
jgi:2,3-bisphosphoglycerate-independent phosphoglycerate mutase